MTEETRCSQTFIDAACADAESLNKIARALSGKEWSADTLDAVADVVRSTGRTISEPGAVPAYLQSVVHRDDTGALLTRRMADVETRLSRLEERGSADVVVNRATRRAIDRLREKLGMQGASNDAVVNAAVDHAEVTPPQTIVGIGKLSDRMGLRGTPAEVLARALVVVDAAGALWSSLATPQVNGVRVVVAADPAKAIGAVDVLAQTFPGNIDDDLPF